MGTIPGKWERAIETTSMGDSTLNSRKFDRAPHEHMTELTMGVVVDAEPEPGYVRVSAICEPEVGFTRNQCAWPGPNVTVGKSGRADGSREEIHGFYDAPLPGQAVLLGFVNGRMGSPVVIQKYSGHIDQRPHLETLHDLPLTSQGHDWRDVLIGSFTGSLIALRGGVPLPGKIEIRAATDVEITARTGIIVEANTDIEIDTLAEVFVNGDAGVRLGPEPRQPVVLGDYLADFLDQLIEIIKDITVICAPEGAPSGTPINSTDFTALAATVDIIKSLHVKSG